MVFHQGAPKEVEFRICLFHERNRLMLQNSDYEYDINISNCCYSEDIVGGGEGYTTPSSSYMTLTVLAMSVESSSTRTV